MFSTCYSLWQWKTLMLLRQEGLWLQAVTFVRFPSNLWCGGCSSRGCSNVIFLFLQGCYCKGCNVNLKLYMCNTIPVCLKKKSSCARPARGAGWVSQQASVPRASGQQPRGNGWRGCRPMPGQQQISKATNRKQRMLCHEQINNV